MTRERAREHACSPTFNLDRMEQAVSSSCSYPILVLWSSL